MENNNKEQKNLYHFSGIETRATRSNQIPGRHPCSYRILTYPKALENYVLTVIDTHLGAEDR